MYDIYQESVEYRGWGTDLKHIIDLGYEMNIREPQFWEIGDLLRVNLYRPHPERVTDKGAVKSVRRFLDNAGVKNDDL